MKAIVPTVFTATLFVVCSAFPLYEKSARGQQSNSFCATLAYPQPNPAAYVHLCYTPGEGTCITANLPRCLPSTMQNATPINVTLSDGQHQVLFSATSCEPGICYYSVVTDCKCNSYPCDCGPTTPSPPTPPIPPFPPFSPSTTPPPTTPPPTTPPPSTITIPPTTPSRAPQCEAGVDLYFVIDSTGTLGSDGHAAVRESVVNIVKNFSIGTNKDTDLTGLSRVDVIQFWGISPFKSNPESQATVDIELGNYADKNDLVQKIENLEYKNGASTIIPHGLAKLNEEIDKHDDPARSIYALVLTDGVDDSTPSNRADLKIGTLKEEADKIKARKNVEVFAIGFTNNRNMANLETIASPGNVISAVDIGGALSRTYNQLITSFCPNSNIRLLTTPASVVSVNSACRCVHLPYGGMLCDPVGCNTVNVKEEKQDKEVQEQEAMEHEILNAIESILAKEHHG